MGVGAKFKQVQAVTSQILVRAITIWVARILESLETIGAILVAIVQVVIGKLITLNRQIAFEKSNLRLRALSIGLVEVELIKS